MGDEKNCYSQHTSKHNATPPLLSALSHADVGIIGRTAAEGTGGPNHLVRLGELIAKYPQLNIV